MGASEDAQIMRMRRQTTDGTRRVLAEQRADMGETRMGV